MEMEYIQSFCTLQQELNQAKTTLISLNNNIRRIVGRDPNDNTRGEKHNEDKRADLERLEQKDNCNTSHKKRNFDSKSSVFNRLSAPSPRIIDEEFRPRVNSRVIRELPSRQEIVAAQCSDAESRARNRRMFGSLLGTLHKFCVEESRLKQKEDKKAKVEKKLEQQELREKECMKKEREMLFTDRKRKQLEIRKLELKMNRLKDFETWESSQKYLKNYIRTKTKPHIYFKPRVFNKNHEKLLLDAQNSLNNDIRKKKQAVNKEIGLIEERFKIQVDDNGNNCLSNSTSCVAVKTLINIPICESKKEDKICNDIGQPPEIQIKNDMDFKENHSRNLNESTQSRAESA